MLYEDHETPDFDPEDIFDAYREKLEELTGLIYQLVEPFLPHLSLAVANIILEEGVEDDIEAQIRYHAERLVKDFYVHLKTEGKLPDREGNDDGDETSAGSTASG